MFPKCPVSEDMWVDYYDPIKYFGSELLYVVS